MYLYEHRRCYDNIIGYCNTLCYHGKLLPKRGREESNLMPEMGYLHIDGKGELASSGSRYNLLEAETIAVWLAENQQNIEAHYGKSLHEVVGIVTPFSAQVSTIKQVLGKQGISTGANEKIAHSGHRALSSGSGKSDCDIRQSIQNMKTAGLLIAITAC